MKYVACVGLAFCCLPIVVSAAALSSACTDTPGDSSSGDAAIDGAVSPPVVEGGGADAGCSTEGTGSMALRYYTLGDLEGPPHLKVVGPTGAVEDVPTVPGITTASLDSRPAGQYTVTAPRARQPDSIVSYVIDPTVTPSAFCLSPANQVVDIIATPIPSSNKLWIANANNDSGQLLGFGGANLKATGAPAATVAMKGVPTSGPGKAIAFDRDGNLWSIGATTADAPLLRFAAADLGASGVKTPDRKIDPNLSGCSPALTSLAFDPSGALWAANLCADQILRVKPATLGASTTYTPAADDIATGVNAPRQLAFDKAGNMWVSTDVGLHRFAAAALAPGQPHTHDFTITVKSASAADLPPDALAFDKDGNLWVVSFGANAIFKLTPADQTPAGPTKEVVPSILITIDVGALLEGLAFDNSGGIWITYSNGKLARLAPTQLGTSTTAGAPTIPETILTSADIGSTVAMAFFPAAPDLPLYGRFPVLP